MRQARVLALAVALCASSVARADFLLNGYKYSGIVNDVFEIYALNDGLHGTGTLIVADDIAMIDFIGGTAAGGGGFVFKYQNNSLFAPADLTGMTLYNSSGHNPAVLFGGHQDRTFVNLLGDHSVANPAAYDVTSTHPENDGVNYFMRQVEWEQAGTVAGGVDASPAANGGRGALVAVAVVPHGDDVMVLSRLEGVDGVFGTPDWPAPEPGGAMLIALVLGTAVLHRRRA